MSKKGISLRIVYVHTNTKTITKTEKIPESTTIIINRHFPSQKHLIPDIVAIKSFQPTVLYTTNTTNENTKQ